MFNGPLLFLGDDDFLEFSLGARRVADWKPDGAAAPLPYLALEYVEGASLKQVWRQRPQEPRAAAALIATLAQAIHAAHERGIVHRDFKPANILLAVSDGRGAENAVPKIADFGLASRADAAEHLTGTGEILGTPSYMAPEQARGDTTALGPGVDVYALGAMLYEALAGHPPFQAATAPATLLRVAHEEPPLIRQVNPAVPRDLATICMKCLEREPTRRYSSALELAADLQRWRDGRPIAARPIGRAARAWHWRRRGNRRRGPCGARLLESAGLPRGVLCRWPPRLLGR